MQLAPQRCGHLAWITCFSYLTYLHWAAQSTENWKSGQMDFTGGVMVLMLKLISVAVSYQDKQRLHAGLPLGVYQRRHVVLAVPSPLEMLSFVYAGGNLLAGPPVEYADWRDFMELQAVWAPYPVRPQSTFNITVSAGTSAAPSFTLQSTASALAPQPYVTSATAPQQPDSAELAARGLSALRRVAQAMVLVLLFLRLCPFINMGLLATPWFHRQHLMVRLLTMQVSDMVYTMQHFFVWQMSEAATTASMLNLKEHDPDTGKPIWGRCCNAHPLSYFAASRGRLVPRAWNIQTGNFLRRYCYDRLPRRAGTVPAFPQLLATQMVSGLWHGLNPGYHMFFASSALYLHAASVLARWERSSAPWLQNSWLWRAVSVYWTNLGAHYLGVAFVLLDFQSSLAAWRSVYFLPHIGMLLLCALGLAWPQPPLRSAAAAAAAASRKDAALCSPVNSRTRTQMAPVKEE